MNYYYIDFGDSDISQDDYELIETTADKQVFATALEEAKAKTYKDVEEDKQQGTDQEMIVKYLLAELRANGQLAGSITDKFNYFYGF